MSITRLEDMKAKQLDWRNIRNGLEIPTENYSDQPYIVKTDDGAWLCVVTTGRGLEGERGQHIITLRSTDMGHTWEPPVDVEPADGPEASYAVLLKAPNGRIFCFYNHNTDERPYVLADNPPFADGKCTRVDSQGHFVFKYSDDHGRSWSAARYEVHIREMEIDRRNPYGGKVRFFWNVGKPFIYEGAAYVSVHKVGGFGMGFFTRSEGVLVRSRNLFTVTDMNEVEWETLPDGDYGLRTPPGGGPVAEEQSYSVLSDGSFFCVYRTVDGHPACSYSRDGGHTWSTPQYMRFADGRLMRHPRAANFAWRCENGKYLYWFHNHGGHSYEDRNPVWFCGGIETDSPEGKVIQWTQPEIVLYDDDPFIRISYPDLVEDGGAYYLTETQKDVARTHIIDPTLLEGLWNQFERAEITSDGLVLDQSTHGTVPNPTLRPFLTRDYSRTDMGCKDLPHGFTVDIWVKLDVLTEEQVLVDTRTSTGQGWSLQTTTQGTIKITLSDGRSDSAWDCDVDMLEVNRLHHVVAIVDGGPKLVLFVIDGRLCDGGGKRQFGWGRFNPLLRDVHGAKELYMDPQVLSLRVYNRALRISEAIANFRAGMKKQ